MPWRHLVLKVAKTKHEQKIATEIYCIFETRSLCILVARKKPMNERNQFLQQESIMRWYSISVVVTSFYFVCAHRHTHTSIHTYKTLQIHLQRQWESVKPKIAKRNWKEAWNIASVARSHRHQMCMQFLLLVFIMKACSCNRHTHTQTQTMAGNKNKRQPHQPGHIHIIWLCNFHPKCMAK